MNLTYNQFQVLTIIEREKRELSEEELVNLSGISLNDIEETVLDLKNKKMIAQDNIITEKGLEFLEPYRVKRAIFLAAGFGSRLMPITLNTPKPLVSVNGKRMIETVLDAVVKAEIPEVIVVTGYLKEQFQQLLDKYPNIKFIENKMYNAVNNIYSAFLTKDMLKNSYILEADMVLYNNKLIRKYEYQSNFVGKFVNETDSWCFETENGIITGQKLGGNSCYQMYGITYCDEKDGEKLSKDITEVYNMPGGKEKYWDQVPLEVCKQNYNFSIRECGKNDIIEIDTFEELKEADPRYCE